MQCRDVDHRNVAEKRYESVAKLLGLINTPFPLYPKITVPTVQNCSVVPIRSVMNRTVHCRSRTEQSSKFIDIDQCEHDRYAYIH